MHETIFGEQQRCAISSLPALHMILMICHLLIAQVSRNTSARVAQLRVKQKMLKKVHSRTGACRRRFKCVSVDKYTRIKGKTPEQAGLKTKTFERYGKEKKFVMIAVDEDSDFEYIDEDKEGVFLEQELNNSANILREGQLEREFSHGTHALDQAIADAASATALFESEEEP